MMKVRVLMPIVLSIVSAGCGGGSMATTTTNDNPPPGSASLTVSNTSKGSFAVSMSTSFQPAEWDYKFFANFPSATTPLNNLLPQHIRLQPVSQGVPQKADRNWDFTMLNAILDPVIGVADKSPELQVATAPAWMDDSSGSLMPAHFSDFAAYSADIVAYYNTSVGFQDTNGMTHVHSPLTPITYWGIFNEPNFNNIDPAQYTLLYNMTVPAMHASDPTIKFAAVELGDYQGLAQTYLPAFVNGVSAQVDVLATHFYSTCNQIDSDTKLFSTIPGFVSEVNTIYSLLRTNPMLTNVPVWVTENNVNADFDKGGGISACNGNTFVTDLRGSSAFFAAWRPYVFSQLGKAGVQALYHWAFEGDKQYGEFSDSSGGVQLSYWVDYYLARMFPSTVAGSNLLDFTSADTSDIEVLPVRNADGSTVVMIADYAVASSSDNNGKGVARTVSVDVSALGSFKTASLLVIDSNTNVSAGPTSMSLTPTSPITISLGGYGVAFLRLQP
jgi:Glycosyl hydrolase catalytic core